MTGDWTQSLKGYWGVDTTEMKNKDSATLWTTDGEECSGEFKLSRFSTSLTEFEPSVLPTDSRRRLDSIFLLKGDTTKATAWKRVSEHKQRIDEKQRNEAWAASSGKSKPDSDLEAGWKPSWFVLTQDHQQKDFWLWNSEEEYWNKREKCLQEAVDVSSLKSAWIAGTAVDFPEYEVSFQEEFARAYRLLDGKTLAVTSPVQETSEEGRESKDDLKSGGEEKSNSKSGKKEKKEKEKKEKKEKKDKKKDKKKEKGVDGAKEAGEGH